MKNSLIMEVPERRSMQIRISFGVRTEKLRYRPEYDRKTIGRNLKRLRELKKLSVDEVRKYLRLGSVQAVYKYEKGVSYPPVDTMFALMELYEADLKDIIGDHETERPVFPEAFKLSGVAPADMAGRLRIGSLKRYYELYMEYINTAAG